MGLVQEINVASSQTTFGSVASTFFTMALNECGPQEKCWKITGESVKEVPELASSHEEAHMELLLHATNAGGRRVIKLSLS